jgi:predicted  nucleic acid-binding Zn-ribbon protein
VHPDLKTVIELQAVDLKIAGLTSRIDATPAQIEAFESELQHFTQSHEERKQRLAADQKERRELEGEIQSVQVKISRHKNQLYEVKTNEQYRAMLKEIEGEEANIRKIEDGILEKMVEAEELQKQVQEAVVVLEREKARVAAEKTRLESLRRAAVAERDQELSRRQELASALSADVLDRYERLRKARHGVAIAEVRDGYCLACNVLLRPQAYNEARTNQSILACDNCVRILYYLDPQVAASDQDQDARAAV